MRGTATHPFVSCLTDASDVKSLNGANQRIPECESYNRTENSAEAT